MNVVVLGAGLLGVTSAWYLARAGHRVTVVDRQPQAGLETSFANGGQISVSHSEPWANPSAPLQILQWLGRDDAPMRFRPRADLRQWEWAARFFVECLPARARRNAAAAYVLARYSQRCLDDLVRETQIEFDRSPGGILHFFSDPRLLEHAWREARRLQARGFEVTLKSPDECVLLEPALKDALPLLKGGIWAPTDESGDACRFVQALVVRAGQAGVSFRFNNSVKRLEALSGRISRVVIDDELGVEKSLRADAYIVALGSYSPQYLRPMGIRLPIYPVKGYSITVPLADGDIAPRISLTDHARKIVFSRLGSRLRVAGTAELNGFNTEIDAARCDALIRRTRELFPRIEGAGPPALWTGLRPATPSNQPLIGATKYPNLFLNTGHGTLGWTLACGSGRAIADIIDGVRPEPDFPFLLH